MEEAQDCTGQIVALRTLPGVDLAIVLTSVSNMHVQREVAAALEEGPAEFPVELSQEAEDGS